MLVPVTVARQMAGRAEATVAVVGTATPASIDMRLYPGVPCPQLSVTTPTPQQAQFVHKMGVAGRWPLPALQVDQNYGLVAKALDQAGAVIGFGCVPIDGNQLLQAAAVTFVVPLPAVAVSFGKKFEAASEFGFAPELAKGAKAVADAWGKLSLCPRDPAQIWLDCTLDALGPQGSANAPLDCVPESDEGPLGLLLAAKRGVFTAVRPTCRGDTDRGGQASADGQVFALFANAPSPERSALPDLAKAAAGLFARIRFSSTLEFSASGKAQTWLVTHTAKSLGFPVGDAFYSVPLGERPGKTSRFVVGTLNEVQSQISIASHGFGLNLGEAAHAAFRARLFAAPGFPKDEAAFLGKVFSQAQHTSGASSAVGCAAVDALLCPQLAQSEGCLQVACERGVEALAKTLTAGFESLASDDLDLFLQGTAGLTDRATDGTVRGLGSLVPNLGSPGLWSGELRGQGGVSAVTGLWVAISQPNQPGSL